MNYNFLRTDSSIILKWPDSKDKLTVLVGNRVGETLESTPIDEWHLGLSGDYPVDTGIRGISLNALKANIWLIGPSICRSKGWPFKPDQEVINEIRLKDHRTT